MRRFAFLRFLLPLFPTGALALLACGSSERAGFGAAPAPTTTGFGTSDAGPDAMLTDGCSEEAKLVYVVSEGGVLYSFTPNKLLFTKVGELDCPSGPNSTNSMAIDRSGTAWVNYSDGSLFKVSTKDAHCEATSYVKGQQGFVKYGMAFATTSAGTTNETLFVAHLLPLPGEGLAKINLSSLELQKIGAYSGDLEGMGAELTGTGDGRLFGFFTTTPNATLAQIDQATGETSKERELVGVTTGSAWAFSFWGGDFWFYTSTGGPSKVTQLKTSDDNSIVTAMEDVGGFRIVGAGVSTCAPTSPPR